MQNRQMMLVAGLMGVILLLLGLAAGLAVSGLLVDEGEPVAQQVDTADSATSIANQPTLAENSSGNLPVPPTVEIPPTVTMTPSITPTTTAMPIPTETPEATETPSHTPTATPTETPTPSPTPTREGPQAEAIEEAGFFAGPGTSFGRRNYFATSGEMVVVLGQDETGQWWHVISQENSYEGWVAARFFEVWMGDVSSLALSDFRVRPSATAVASNNNNDNSSESAGSGTVSNAPLQPTGQTNAEAYWNFVESAAVAERDENRDTTGTWRGEILVRVPTGFNYQFQYGPTIQQVRLMMEDQDGFDTYQLFVGGMGCGPYVTDMMVLQNGAQMVVKNEFTRRAGPVFIQFDCD